MRAPASITPSTGEAGAPERCRGPGCPAGSACSGAPSSSGLTVLRTTTGGIGREPGMVNETRVVSVVSVFGTSCSAGGSGRANGSPPGAGAPKPFPRCGMPYGGVPDGYASGPVWRGDG